MWRWYPRTRRGAKVPYLWESCQLDLDDSGRSCWTFRFQDFAGWTLFGLTDAGFCHNCFLHGCRSVMMQTPSAETAAQRIAWWRGLGGLGLILNTMVARPWDEVGVTNVTTSRFFGSYVALFILCFVCHIGCALCTFRLFQLPKFCTAQGILLLWRWNALEGVLAHCPKSKVHFLGDFHGFPWISMDFYGFPCLGVRKSGHVLADLWRWPSSGWGLLSDISSR